MTRLQEKSRKDACCCQPAFRPMIPAWQNRTHSAALALIGWYLMVPPIVGDHANTSAPLSRWEMGFGAYDTAAACQKGVSDSVREALKASKDPHLDRIHQNLVLQYLN